MRPDPKLIPGPALILMLVGVMVIAYSIGYTNDVKPRKDFIASQTKKVLDKAHKEAQNSVDTLNVAEYRVDTKSATTDSARLTQKMRKWMDSQGENPRFCDYKEVYDTIITNERVYYRLSKFGWRINVDKATKDTSFARIYDQYRQAIQQLEIDRRQR